MAGSSAEPVLMGAGDRLRPRVDPELAEDVGDMPRHRGWADKEALADLAVALASDEQSRDLDVADSQAVEDRGWE